MKMIFLLASMLLSNSAFALGLKYEAEALAEAYSAGAYSNDFSLYSLKACNPNSEFIKNHNQLFDDLLDKKRKASPDRISFNSETAAHSVLAREIAKLAKDKDTTVYQVISDKGLSFGSRKLLNSFLRPEDKVIVVTGAKPNCLMVTIYNSLILKLQSSETVNDLMEAPRAKR